MDTPGTNNTAEPIVYTADGADNAWLLVSSALVFQMIPALGLFYGGLTNSKNILNTIMLSMVCAGIISIQWLVWGYTFAFGPGNSVWGDFTYGGLKGVGADPNPDYAPTVSHLNFCLFQMMFAAITPALISGAILERMKFSSYVIFIFVWSTLVYDPVAHWIWSASNVTHPDDPMNVGWLRNLGVVDFAGGIVIHLTAGFSSIIATLIIGKRRNTPQEKIHAHNIPFVLMGAGLLWFGWFGFNGGSAGASSSVAVQASFNTQIGAAMGMCVWMLLEVIFTPHHKVTTVGAATGAIVGLATITPGAGYVTSQAALVFGAVGPALTFLTTRFKYKLAYDDALDVFAAHGIGGATGAVLTGIFATTEVNTVSGAVDGNGMLIVWQIVGCAVAMALSGIITAVTLLILKATLGLQVSENTEDHGLDSKYHEEEAYHLDEAMVELHSDSSATSTPSHSTASPTLVLATSQDLLLSPAVESPANPRKSIGSRQSLGSKPVQAAKQVSHVESSAEQSEEASSSQQQSSSQQSTSSSEESSDS